MKYKKFNYILVFVLMLMVGMNRIYAVESKYCYYVSDDNGFKSALKISWGYKAPLLHGLNAYAKVSVDKLGEGIYDFDDESVLNWWPNLRTKCVTNGTTCFEDRYKSSTAANNDSNPSCPKYLVFQYCKMYAVWSTDSESIAKQAVSEIHSNGCTGFYGSYEKDGKPITEEEYYDEFVDEGLITIDNGELECNDLLGDESDPDSLRSMIDTIMSYIRIIVPILIILLGTIDLAKAVIAGKEDNIKKAQTDFIKRIIAGVAVFLVPVLIDIIMDLAEIVWQGESYKICKF